MEIVGHPDSQEKLETLHDFVDVETISLYKSSFNEKISNLKSIKEALEPIIAKLLASINQRIFEVK